MPRRISFWRSCVQPALPDVRGVLEQVRREPDRRDLEERLLAHVAGVDRTNLALGQNAGGGFQVEREIQALGDVHGGAERQDAERRVSTQEPEGDGANRVVATGSDDPRRAVRDRPVHARRRGLL